MYSYTHTCIHVYICMYSCRCMYEYIHKQTSQAMPQVVCIRIDGSVHEYRYANGDASAMAPSKALVLPLAAPTMEMQSQRTVSKPTPGHLVMACHSFTLAAIQVFLSLSVSLPVCHSGRCVCLLPYNVCLAIVHPLTCPSVTNANRASSRAISLRSKRTRQRTRRL